jgi:hypothetical protein
MRIFYTENDIEEMAARGVQQLEVGPEVILTDAARQHAEGLGIALVLPGSAPTRNVPAPAAVAQSATPPSRPPGCQRGSAAATSRRVATAGSGGPVVDQLVAAVSALKKQGG